MSLRAPGTRAHPADARVGGRTSALQDADVLAANREGGWRVEQGRRSPVKRDCVPAASGSNPRPIALLADTDERSVRLMEHQFGGCGYDVACSTTSVSFKSALFGVDRDALELVVVDESLLREASISPAEIAASAPEAPIVVTSAFPSLASALLAGRQGAHSYVPKPVWPLQVLAAIQGREGAAAVAPDVAARPPSLERMRWEYVQLVLQSCGSIRQTSEILNIPRRSLQRFLSRPPPAR
jgi:ActR/RegA family two-component response regulator